MYKRLLNPRRQSLLKTSKTLNRVLIKCYTISKEKEEIVETLEARREKFKGLPSTKMPLSKSDEDKILKFMRYAHEGKEEELKKNGYEYVKETKSYRKIYVSDDLKKMEEEGYYFDKNETLLDKEDVEVGIDIFQVPEISKEAPLPSVDEILAEAELVLQKMNSKEGFEKFEKLTKPPTLEKWKQDILPFHEKPANTNLDLFDSEYFDETDNKNDNSKEADTLLDEELVDIKQEEEEEDDDPEARYIQFKVSDEAIDALRHFEYEIRASDDLDPKRDRITTREKNHLIDMCLFAFDEGKKQEEILEKKLDLYQNQEQIIKGDISLKEAIGNLRDNKLYKEIEGLEFIHSASQEEVIQNVGDIRYTFGYDETKGRITRKIVVEEERKTIESLFESKDIKKDAKEIKKHILEKVREYKQEMFDKLKEKSNEAHRSRMEKLILSIDPDEISRLANHLHKVAAKLGFDGNLRNIKENKPQEWDKLVEKLQEMAMVETDDSDLIKAMALYDIDPDAHLREYLTEQMEHEKREEIRKIFKSEIANGTSVESFIPLVDDALSKSDPKFQKYVEELHGQFLKLTSSISELSEYIPVEERKKIGLGSDLSSEGIFQSMLKAGIKAEKEKKIPDRSIDESNVDDLLSVIDQIDQIDMSNMSEEEAEKAFKEIADRLPKYN